MQEIGDRGDRLRQIAATIAELKEERKKLNDGIKDLLAEAEKLGVPKKAMRLVIAMLDEKKRAEFDYGFMMARTALGIPVQAVMEFEEAV